MSLEHRNQHYDQCYDQHYASNHYRHTMCRMKARLFFWFCCWLGLLNAGVGAQTLAPGPAPAGAATSVAPTALPVLPPPEQAGNAPGRAPQRVERIRLEDASNRIEEVRYGGDTQRISVAPKGIAPEYEIPPANAARGSVAQREGLGSPPSQRVWNLLRF